MTTALAGELGAVKRVPYSYIIDFNQTIADGGQLERTLRVDADTRFEIDRWLFVAWTMAVIGSAPAGTPFVREPTALSTSAPVPSLAKVFLEFSVNNQRFSNGPVSALLATGDGRKPGYPLDRLTLPAGMTFSARIVNNSGHSLQGQLVLGGSKLMG